MNILFYYPSNLSAISLSSLMIAFRKQGHEVFLLTQSEEGDLHREVRPYGVRTFSYPLQKRSAFPFYLKHARHLARFISEHRIDVCYSHLQQANIVAVFAQRFCSARMVICRHHSDSAYVEVNRNAQRFDRVINRLGREFIAPSEKVYRQMTEVEKANPSRIHLIRYAYDFSMFPRPDEQRIEAIRSEHPCRLLLVKAARLIPEKRHLILFRAVRELVRSGCDIRLLVLSEGYLRPELEQFIAVNGLERNIFMLGHRKNIIDYLAAADVVVHISASEASNNLVKEAALAEKCVIACRDVGDFDDYLVNMQNAILLSKEQTEGELLDVLGRIYRNEIETAALGSELKGRVLERYSIDRIIGQYDRFHKI